MGRPCQEAFDILKECLTTAPVLSILTCDDALYVLATDASDVDIGVILTLVQDEKEMVVA